MKLSRNVNFISTKNEVTHLYYMGSSLYFETGSIPSNELNAFIEELQNVALDDIDIDSLCDIRSGMICSLYDYGLFEGNICKSLQELELVENKILNKVYFQSFLPDEEELETLRAHNSIEVLPNSHSLSQLDEKALLLIAVSQHQYKHLEHLHETLSTPWAAIIYDHFGFSITPVFGLSMGPCYNCYRMLFLSNLSSIDEHNRIEHYFSERKQKFKISKRTLKQGESTLQLWIERLLSGKPYGDYDHAILFDAQNLDFEKVRIPSINMCNFCFE
ncbi:hypothetical protein [Vibrio coralliilyticus]|uniref:hypothetical protein n=1 Tax=Vibrio coralliilyticus TaxID=190893 RepID=UPI0020A330EF|nr:hypothetical protein [Vibrio coralliilyticus]